MNNQIKIMFDENVSQKFQNFCENNKFKFIDGSNIIPSSDDLLFNIAGITNKKFKDILDSTKSNKNFKRPKGFFYSLQTCIRLEDLTEIGDNSHLTSFIMLGVFSFDQNELTPAINHIWNFITNIINPINLIIKINKKDKKGFDSWKKIIDSSKIILLDKNECWWQSGKHGLSGWGTEIFYIDPITQNELEIVNIVGIRYNNNNEIPLIIDIGMGLERINSIINNRNNVYNNNFKKYLNVSNNYNIIKKDQYIIADHLRTISVLLDNKVFPGNKGRNYITRKLIKIVLEKLLQNNINFEHELKILENELSIELYKFFLIEYKLMLKSLEQAKKYCKKNNIINPKLKYSFLKDTFGLNDFLFNKLIN